MDAKSDESLRERTFGHCIVTWVIKNYGWSLWQNDLEISTPEFSIKGPGSQVTKWKLTGKCEFDQKRPIERLKVNIQSESKEDSSLISKALKQESFDLNTNEVDKEKIDFCCDNNEPAYPIYPIKKIKLRLERIEFDECQSDIWVNWKVYLIGINGVKYALSHRERCFFKDQIHGFNIGIMHDFGKGFEDNFGEITILCDMVVKDLYADIYSDYDVATIELQSLSKDFQWIFNQKIFCDAEIKVDGQSIMVHKAILCSHSSYFDDLFKNGNTNVIEISDTNYNEMLKILEYIYTYDLKDVIGQPSVCVYETATLMKLKNLTTHYVPEEYKIRTVLDIKNLTFYWTIKNCTIEEIHCRSTLIFTEEFSDSKWQIHLYSKGIDCESEYIAIAAECIEGDIDDDLCVQCVVLNNEKLGYWKILHKAENSDIFEENNFISREDVAKLLNDSLILGLKIGIYNRKESSITYKPCEPFLDSMKIEFNDMSKNMLSLRESNKHTDFVFKVGENEIKAHSYILSARSYLLSKIIKEKTNVILLPPEVFNVLLDYMYCAILNVSDIETVIDVYKAAMMFVVSSLQAKCSFILQNNVTLKEVASFYRLACNYNDKYLKQAILDFLSLNESKFSELVLKEVRQSCEAMENLKTFKSIVHDIEVMKYGKSIESCDLEESSKSSNIAEETTDENERTLSTSDTGNYSSLDEYEMLLYIVDKNGRKKQIRRLPCHGTAQNLVDTIPKTSESTETPILALDKEDYKNKDISGIEYQNKEVTSQIFFPNSNIAKNEQISFTCKSSSVTRLNNYEVCGNETAPRRFK